MKHKDYWKRNGGVNPIWPAYPQELESTSWYSEQTINGFRDSELRRCYEQFKLKRPLAAQLLEMLFENKAYEIHPHLSEDLTETKVGLILTSLTRSASKGESRMLRSIGSYIDEIG